MKKKEEGKGEGMTERRRKNNKGEHPKRLRGGGVKMYFLKKYTFNTIL